MISKIELELGPGLTLLTGETGAGKSILIDALGLLLGTRASTELVRTGESRAVVEGIADGGWAAPILAEHGVPLPEDEELILRREIPASGKTRATVNGALVPLAVLRELAPGLAVIHGQHEPQGLLDPDSHLALVDHHGRLESLAAETAEAYKRLRGVEARLAELRRDRRELERRREMLEYQVSEIGAAVLEPGEEDRLRQEKRLQANAGQLAELAGAAFALLYEDEHAVLGHLGLMYRKLEELARIDPRFATHLEARTATLSELEDLALFLRDYRGSLEVVPGRLDEIESRLALIERLKRKYGASVEEVIGFGEQCRQELEMLESPERREAALEAERRQAAEGFLAQGRELSAKRRAAARDLERRVRAELSLLAMEKTRFRVRFDPEEAAIAEADASLWSERGLERAELLLSPNPGEELRPLARIASGGELSRILLALKSVASLDGHGKTLVFDEVDAGIGGRVAEIVGRKLRAMASRHQVLCVTHLPQIACQADHHLRVSKRTERGRTVTEVERLSPSARVEELARMLGGESVTESARHHAREMMKLGPRSDRNTE